MRTFDLAPLYRSTVGFDRLFLLLDQGIEGGAPGYPPYNIERTGENEYRVTVAVAGFSEAELSVVAKENTLTIRGEKRVEENQKDKNVQLSERSNGVFYRVLQFPPGIDPSSVQATMANGILKVTIPKPAKAEPKKIEVKEAA